MKRLSLHKSCTACISDPDESQDQVEGPLLAYAVRLKRMNSLMRSLKITAQTLIAFLLLGLTVPSAALPQFESEAEFTPLSVSSSAMQKIAPTAGGTAVECTTIWLYPISTQLSRETTFLEIEPAYTNCEPFLGASTSVYNASCDYRFHLAKGKTHGTMDIVCAKDLEITVGSICKYTIGTQYGLGTVGFKNTGAGTTREVIVEPNVTGITSTRTTNHFFCPAAGSTGTMVGSFTITGESTVTTSHVGLFVD